MMSLVMGEFKEINSILICSRVSVECVYLTHLNLKLIAK